MSNKSRIEVAKKSETWRESAACKGQFGHLFYPSQSGERESRHDKRIREQQAKRICARCPVTDECLAWALRNHELTGVWGGTTEVERRAMIREGQAPEAS